VDKAVVLEPWDGRELVRVMAIRRVRGGWGEGRAEIGGEGGRSGGGVEDAERWPLDGDCVALLNSTHT